MRWGNSRTTATATAAANCVLFTSHSYEPLVTVMEQNKNGAGGSGGGDGSKSSNPFPWPPKPPPNMKKALSEPCNIVTSLTKQSKIVGDPNRRVSEIYAMGSSSRRRGGSGAGDGISYMVDSWRKMSSKIHDKRPDIERAVEGEDEERLRSLCEEDRDAAAAAAGFAIGRDSPDRLDKVLSIAQALGFDPELDLLDADGNGILHIAARSGSLLSMELLLQKYGFNPNKWNSKETSTSLHAAASEGQLDALLLLKSYGGNINVGIDEGKSVLHEAVRSNQLEVIRYLLENKADKMGKGRLTETPLHVAAEQNHYQCARLLLADGILVDAKRGEDRMETALHVAAANGYQETVSLLLENGANPDFENRMEETPLHLAAWAHSVPVMELLLEKGCNVNARDKDGRTPLHFAVNSKEKGGAESLHLLARKKADLNLTDSMGMTPLHLAAENKKYNRVRILIRAGADLCVMNKMGKSALNYVLKRVPSSIESIVDRLDSGVQIDWTTTSESDAAELLTYSNTVKMDFNLVMPSKASGATSSDVAMFNEMLKIHANDSARLQKVLMHPLSLCFLHFKWQQVRFLYYFLLLSHIIYSLTFTGYVVLLYGHMCNPAELEVSDIDVLSRFTLQMSCDTSNKPMLGFTVFLWFMLVLFIVLYSLKEITKYFHLRKKYFHEWESILNLMTIVSFPLISFHQNPFGDEPTTVSSWQFHVAGIGAVITWVLNMFLVGKIPKFGKYVQMLIAVGWNFFNFFVAYFSLVVAFALAFVVLFPSEISFSNFVTAPIKVLVMMTGEIDYNSLYYPTNQKINLSVDANGSLTGQGAIEEVPANQIFPLTGHFLLAVFIVIVSIVIMNLLFGMAVSDVQELYKTSRMHQSIQQVALIGYLESILFSPLFYKIPSPLQRYLWKKLHGLEGKYGNVRDVEIDSYDKKRVLPSYLNKALKDVCLKLQDRKRGRPTVHSLQSTINRMEKQMDQMQKLLLAVARANGVAMTSSGGSSPTMSTDDDKRNGDNFGGGRGSGIYFGADATSLSSDFTDSPAKRVSMVSQTSGNQTSLTLISEEEEEAAATSTSKV